jgi:CBS domain-containing protein
MRQGYDIIFKLITEFSKETTEMSLTIPDAARKKISDIMTKEIVKVGPDTRVRDIAQLMTDHGVSGLPVVDKDDQLLGVVTEMDMIVRNTRFKIPNFIMILDHIIYLETPQQFQERLENMLGVTAQEIMTEEPATIAPDATIEELSELMADREVNPIPVVENNRLVGIISRADIIRLMAEG